LASKKKEKEKVVEEVASGFVSKYPGIIKSAKEFQDKPTEIIQVSPAHDLGLGGGIPKGSWVNVAGKPKTHKSTTCLHIARNCQQAGMTVYYANIEGRLKKRDILPGLDLDRFHIIGSSEETLMTAVEYLTTFEEIFKSTKDTCLIIDSVSMLADEKEIEGGIGTSTRGGGAKYLAQFCRNMAGIVPVRNHIVISILQLMANTSGYGSPFQEKGGNAIVYQSDIRLIVKHSELIESGDKTVGANVKWLTLASALNTPPGQEYISTIRYGEGIDTITEIINIGEGLGLIDKSGAWYKVIGNEDVRGQGLEKFREELASKPDMVAKIYAEIKDML
jgi:recombination protein RecA